MREKKTQGIGALARHSSLVAEKAPVLETKQINLFRATSSNERIEPSNALRSPPTVTKANAKRDDRLEETLDEVDQFLSEIIRQQWSVNEPAKQIPVQTAQTLFPRSRVKPKSLAELNEWALTLRDKVRHQIMGPEHESLLSSSLAVTATKPESKQTG